ncbi:MAG: hypothetical protein R3B60_02700 [Candidatus Paceibacterota bacterium]
MSWFVWTVVGLALFLTAEASEAKEVYFATIISAAGPAIILVIILLRETNRIYSLSLREKLCLTFALIGYSLWFILGENPELAQWSLYWMICVDFIALWPTLEQAIKKPESDKPIPWIIFGLGYGITGLAIIDHTVANWALPAYMFAGSLAVAIPLVLIRIKKRVLLKEWW